MPTKIDPKKIRTDLNTQIRVELSEETVAEYAELMERNTKFPPILVYYDGTIREYVLADGFHRLAAHQRVRPSEQIAVKVKNGTVDEARWASIGSNKDHGLRRTNADKHNAVTQALMHPEGAGKSDRKIAEYVGVSHTSVQNVRASLESGGKICHLTRRQGKDGKSYPAKAANQETDSPKCVDCHYFGREGRNTFCEADSQRTDILDWTPACADFMARYEEPPPREVPPPDYDNVAEYVEKPSKKSRHCQNRNLKDSVQVSLAMNNPSLFAIELRNNFPSDYLETCMKLLLDILHDDEIQ